MGMEARTVAQSFTYAWWLTGDDDAAARAVRQASARLGADPTPDRVLATVREAAISAPTMCPASEVALLHDSHGIDLPQAALLVEVDADDARTELAHGRLEALPELSDLPFAHPERLGGLAVGNPPDVAHARQCEDCARARELLARGRGALRTLPPVPVPPALLVELAALDHEQAATFTAAPVTVGADDEPLSDAHDHAPADAEHDHAPASADAEHDDEPARPLGTILAVAAIGLGVVLLLVTALTSRGLEPAEELDEARLDTVAREDAQEAAGGVRDDEPVPAEPPADGAPADALADGAPEPDAPTPEPDPQSDAADAPREESQPAALTIRDVRVAATNVLDGAVTPRLGVDEPLRVVVTYAGADDGDVLRAVPAFEGMDLPASDLTLSAPGGSHVFIWPAPADGWPAGPHQVHILTDGTIIATVTVRTGALPVP